MSNNIMLGGYKGRKNWIDFAKAIGIMLVVLAHALPKNTIEWKWIQQFHMPLFYMISGYLYSCKGTWKQYVEKKIKALWLPFIGCGLITVVTKIAVSVLLKHPTDITVKYMIKLVLMLELPPLQGATWFLSVLLYSLIIFDILIRSIHRIIKRNKNDVIIIFIISILVFIVGSNTLFPYYISHIMVAVSYIGIGYGLKNYEGYVEKIPMLVSVMGLIFIVGAAKINNVSVASNSYTYKSLFFLTGIIGSISVLILSKKYAAIINSKYIKKQYEFIGKNTMGILIWQFVSFKLVMIMQILFYKMTWEKLSDFPVIYERSNMGWVIMYTIVGIYFSILIYKILTQLVIKMRVIIK